MPNNLFTYTKPPKPQTPKPYTMTAGTKSPKYPILGYMDTSVQASGVDWAAIEELNSSYYVGKAW